MCSTPFGINETITQPRGVLDRRLIQCSTPFGINETITGVNGHQNNRCRCAQRLSASTKQSQTSCHNNKATRKCAQRLSASTKQSLVRITQTTQNKICAQRLSASTKQSPTCTCHTIRCVKCSTPFGINETITRQVRGLFQYPLGCSTPFGINETITRPHWMPSRNLIVLNAFRHQRNNHLFARRLLRPRTKRAQRLSASTKQSLTGAIEDAGVSKCSTPFGINETITRDAVFGRIGRAKCSTPFGINETITRVPVCPCGASRCAQRLSASTKQSHTRGACEFALTSVLNAFRHQRNNHAIAMKDFQADLMCSTPFGINETITDKPFARSQTSSGAQRLSASTKQSLFRLAVGSGPNQSAQRLSASTKQSQHHF